MSDLFETVRRLVQQELRTRRVAELGVVQEVAPTDPGNYDCTVVLRDSDLVLKSVPLATPRKGFASVPDVGDLVLVQFVGGELNRPLIIGTLYNDEDRPPTNAAEQLVIQLPASAEPAESVRLELTEKDPRKLKLNIGSAYTLTLQDDDPVVSLDVGGQLTLSIEKNGALVLDTSGELKLKSAADMTIEAGGKLVLRGATIDLN